MLPTLPNNSGGKFHEIGDGTTGQEAESAPAARAGGMPTVISHPTEHFKLFLPFRHKHLKKDGGEV
jgi:hypothetical protein